MEGLRGEDAFPVHRVGSAPSAHVHIRGLPRNIRCVGLTFPFRAIIAVILFGIVRRFLAQVATGKVDTMGVLR